MAYELFVGAVEHPADASKMAIVSFAGSAEGIGRIPLFEFQRFLDTTCPEYDKFFYHDVKRRWYHKGVQGLSTGVRDTAAYLQDRLTRGNYDKVAFLGASAGGYAALLYGCLVPAASVIIAFNPQTHVAGADLDPAFLDLKPWLTLAGERNNKKFHLIGDVNVSRRDRHHHISQCERVADAGDHVFVHKEYASSDLKSMRNSGELRTLVLACLTDVYEKTKS